MYFLSAYIIQALCGIIVITLHGFLTAFVSYRLGDNTPKSSGQLTLNPIKHFEPLGFIIYVIFGYGWGQPIRTSAYGYKDKKAGCVLTAVMPVIIEIILGYALVFCSLRFEGDFLYAFGQSGVFTAVRSFMGALGKAAVTYGIYNLIPVYPLNGHKLLSGLLAPNKVLKYNEWEKILQLILVFFIFMGVVGRVIGYIYNLPLRLVLGW